MRKVDTAAGRRTGSSARVEMSGEECRAVVHPSSTADLAAVEQPAMVCAHEGRLVVETVLRVVCRVPTCYYDEADRMPVVHLARAVQGLVDLGDCQGPSSAVASPWGLAALVASRRKRARASALVEAVPVSRKSASTTVDGSGSAASKAVQTSLSWMTARLALTGALLLVGRMPVLATQLDSALADYHAWAALAPRARCLR